MNLNTIKKVGKHQLMIDPETLEFYLCKQYEAHSLPIIETLYNNHNLGNIPIIYSYTQNAVSKKITTIEQYLDGHSLRDLVTNCSYITKDQFESYLLDLLNTLIKLHQINLLHKDIKPENIIISDERAYLIDFDISRQYNESKTNDTRLFGTKGYASPEQFGFSQTSDKSDIYSLGITLQELLQITILDAESFAAYTDVLSQMTNIDSNLRPSASELLYIFNEIKVLNISNSANWKTAAQHLKHNIEKNSKFKLKHLLPIVLTDRGMISNILANGFFLLMANEFLMDDEFVYYDYNIILAIISLLLTLSLTNIFVNYFSIPVYRKHEINNPNLYYLKSKLWYGLRLLDYIVYALLLPFFYNILGFIFL